MRGQFAIIGLFAVALAAGCGFNPHPKNGKLPCSEGCPSGYECRADNFCYRTNAPLADSGSDGTPLTTDSTANDLGVAGGDRPLAEAGKDVSTDSSRANDIGGNKDAGSTDTGASADTGGSSADAPVGTGGVVGNSDASGSGGSSGTGGVSSGAGGSRGGTGGTGGTTAMGGMTVTGGMMIAGTTGADGGLGGTGGVATGGAATGGSRATGGTTSTGGSAMSGGTTTTGGTTSAGDTTTTGGTTMSGGTISAGGTTTTGGTTASGGTTSAGGTTTTGGATVSGGTTTTGGATASGGTTTTGGATVSGGTTRAGGTATTGGTTASGGTGASQCVPPPQGIVAWWPGDDAQPAVTAKDIVGSHDGSLSGVSYGTGEVGNAFIFSSPSDIIVPEASQLHASGQATFEMWVNFDSVPRTGKEEDSFGLLEKAYNYLIYWRADLQALEIVMVDGCTDYDYYLGAYASLSDSDLAGSQIVGGQSRRLFHHLTITAIDGGASGPEFHIFVDGQERAVTYDIDPPNKGCGWYSGSTAPLHIGARSLGPSPLYFSGAMDEVTIYSRALTPAEIQAIFAAGSAGKCKTP